MSLKKKKAAQGMSLKKRKSGILGPIWDLIAIHSFCVRIAYISEYYYYSRIAYATLFVTALIAGLLSSHDLFACFLVYKKRVIFTANFVWFTIIRQTALCCISRLDSRYQLSSAWVNHTLEIDQCLLELHYHCLLAVLDNSNFLVGFSSLDCDYPLFWEFIHCFLQRGKFLHYLIKFPFFFGIVLVFTKFSPFCMIDHFTNTGVFYLLPIVSMKGCIGILYTQRIKIQRSSKDEFSLWKKHTFLTTWYLSSQLTSQVRYIIVNGSLEASPNRSYCHLIY